jgi:hypothetical protein
MAEESVTMGSHASGGFGYSEPFSKQTAGLTEAGRFASLNSCCSDLLNIAKSH